MNNNMKALRVLIAILLVPQLLFWWLCPTVTAAAILIYIGGTLLMGAAATVTFCKYRLCGLHATGTAIAAGGMGLVTVLVCGLLLALNVTVRTAAFVLGLTALAHYIVIAPVCRGNTEQHVEESESTPELYGFTLAGSETVSRDGSSVRSSTLPAPHSRSNK